MTEIMKIAIMTAVSNGVLEIPLSQNIYLGIIDMYQHSRWCAINANSGGMCACRCFF